MRLTYNSNFKELERDSNSKRNEGWSEATADVLADAIWKDQADDSLSKHQADIVYSVS